MGKRTKGPRKEPIAAEDLTHHNYDESLTMIGMEDDFLMEPLKKVANRTYFTVIVYDITDNTRRNRLSKLLLGYGDRVQYSGFEGYLTAKQVEALLLQIPAIINEREGDRVRVYKVAGTPQVKSFGRTPLTEDVEFTVI